MNYETAKKLKDAGFKMPVECSSCGYGTSDKLKDFPEHIRYYIPTLSELIEACGGHFEALTHEQSHGGDTWNAIAFHSDKHGHGGTPETAVANLWLELSIKM